MGKDWDKALPDKEIWKECLRVLKPGAFAFVMSIPRADCLSRMIINLEDVGFSVNFTPIFWAYASGFPKAQNIGKAVDKKAGRIGLSVKKIKATLKEYFNKSGLTLKQLNDRCGFEASGYLRQSSTWEAILPSFNKWLIIKSILYIPESYDNIFREAERETTSIDKRRSLNHLTYTPHSGQSLEWERKDAPATPQAKALDGSYGGFQPKPAVEVIIVAMKPLSEKTFVDQALKNGKGITWLDNGRIPYENERDIAIAENKNRHADFDSPSRQNEIFGQDNRPRSEQGNYNASAGRFPANLLVSDDVLNDGREHKGQFIEKPCDTPNLKTEWGGTIQTNRGARGYDDSGSFSRYFNLDKWAQKTFPFLITPKASKGEKNERIDMPRVIKSALPLRDGSGNYVENEYGDGSQSTRRGRTKNYHPTVKPLKLMSYLITLGSRSGDTVLDPFMGSGTTALASKLLNRKCIGIEIDERYCEMATERCSQSIFNWGNE